MPVHCRSMSWDQGIFIAELNIEHYRTKLTGQLDEGQRQTITTLLAEEEARLFDLKAVAAERELSAFIALLARRAPGLFDDTLPDYPQDVRDGLLATIGQVPVGLGVVNNSGEMVLSNGLMQRFVPAKIPSRDPQSIRRFKTRDGPLSPFSGQGQGPSAVNQSFLGLRLSSPLRMGARQRCALPQFPYATPPAASPERSPQYMT